MSKDPLQPDPVAQFLRQIDDKFMFTRDDLRDIREQVTKMNETLEQILAALKGRG